nr:FAD-dependent oxidoreductase [Mesorhizobium sp. WSM3626]
MTAVLVGEHRIEAECIVACAGPNNPDIASLADVPLNGFGIRIEAMALEPTRPLIKPAIALIDSLAYFHQTSRGEVVGGTEVPERPRMSLKVDFPVMANMVNIYLDMFPQLGEDLWFSAGWWHGFAGAPENCSPRPSARARSTIACNLSPWTASKKAGQSSRVTSYWPRLGFSRLAHVQ